ncbi:hypothetical protein L6164_025513 [Bauhinia variegata]|uniref:Uncharacterized protein n=1 Tax=Bauhinia variegata TaxID=167791 RepID=A0ACB9M0R6_BAUVA|nr:hypothetical protein L6164_025513 [Bauhinia variegata]
MSAASKNASTSESHSTILEPPKPNSLTAELQNLGAATRLDGRNYLQWARLVTLALKGKQKLHHLTEDPPNSLDEKYSAWDIEDTIIMTWLLNSMQLEISQNFMFLETSKQIWEMEMDMYRKLKVSEDTQAILREREQDRVFEFLAGLNEAFDHVRVQILGRETLPNLNETFYLTRGEESRRVVMLDSTSNADSALIAERRDNRGSKTNSVFTAARRDNRGSKSDSTKASNRDNLWCTHCKKPRHTLFIKHSPKGGLTALLVYYLKSTPGVLSRDGGCKVKRGYICISEEVHPRLIKGNRDARLQTSYNTHDC